MILFLIFFIFVFQIIRKTNNDWRESVLISSLYFCITLLSITQLLSIQSTLTRENLVIMWSVCITIAFIILKKKKERKTQKTHQIKIDKESKIWIVSTVIILLLVGLIAIISAPNNGDSLTYHLSRIMYWIQNKNVYYYPTFTLRQLHLSPFSEYILLNIRIIDGNDNLVNTLQWLSLIGVIIAITKIAKNLGANLKGQIISLVVLVTIPMAILQASSTQNDIVVSYFLSCFVYFLLQVVGDKKNNNWMQSIYMGVSLGLAILTKGTAYIYAFPFIMYLIFKCIRKPTYLFRILCITFLLVGIINAQHYYENYILFKNPLGASYEGTPDYSYANKIFTPQSLVSNILKNSSLHLASPLYKLNKLIENDVDKIHDLIGIDINDPRTTWAVNDDPAAAFSIPYLNPNEDVSGNMLHFSLFLCIGFLVLIKRQQNKSVYPYFIAVGGSYVLFCFLLSWQLYHSRLHLPFFVLSVPIIAIYVSRIERNIRICVIGILLCSALYFVLLNTTRPLIGTKNIISLSRYSQYFVHSPSLENDFKSLFKDLKLANCQKIGIQSVSDEYLVWVAAEKYIGTKTVIGSVNVSNDSKKFKINDPFKNSNPCSIIYMGSNIPTSVYTNNHKYNKVGRYGKLVLYR